MNGIPLTFGTLGTLAALGLAVRRGSANEIHRVFHFSRSMTPTDLGEGTHWGTERAAWDRWSHLGRPKGALVEAEIRVNRPYEPYSEIGQWLSPAYAISVVLGLEPLRALLERAGMTWDASWTLDDPTDKWLAACDEFDARLHNGTLPLPLSKREAWAPLWRGLITKGYDGIMYPNNTEDVDSDSWITFDPAQVEIVSVTVVNNAWGRPGKRWMR